MSYIFKKGATSQSIEVYIVDSTDGTPETGVVFNTAGIDLKYRRKDAAVVSITEADLTSPALTDTWESGGFLEIGNGVYRLDLPDAALASAAGIDRVVVFGTVTGMVVLPVTIHLTDIDLNDAVRGGMTALPDANADAAGGLPISDGGGLDIDTFLATIVAGTPTLKYMGYYGPGVYIDSGAANENTVTGTDGIISHPVSTFAAARTIADAIGLNRYYLEGNSDITLGATHVDWEFCGVGAVADNTLNFGSQDVSRSRFCNLTLEGTQGGAARIEAIECALQDPGGGATTLHIFALRCGLVDDVEIDTSNNNVFDSCYSLVAGATTPKIIATGAAGTLELRHYSGGIELKALSASHNVSIEGMGQVVFNADCNVNANVSIRGLFTITDNTAGMASLTQDAVVNIPKINAECDTALSDFGPNTTVPDAAGVAPTVAEIQAEMEENGASILDTLRDDLADGGRLDLIFDAIKVMTDWQRSVSGTVVVNNPGTDTIFDLTAVIGTLSTENDIYNGMQLTIYDLSGSIKATRKVSDFVGADGRFTVDRDIGFPVDDGVDTFILWNKYSPTTAAGGGATAKEVHEYDVSGIITEGQAGYEIQQSGGESIYT